MPANAAVRVVLKDTALTPVLVSMTAAAVLVVVGPKILSIGR